MSSEYEVVLRGEVFLLSRTQIEFDSPNFFTEYFLDAPGAHNHSIKLSRNPLLFTLIGEYLSGYAILPISGIPLATQMDQENTLKNLRVDAEFYKLQGLRKLIDGYTQITVLLIIAVRAPPKAESSYMNTETVSTNSEASLLFHFPGRIVNWINKPIPGGYVEVPLSIDLSKSFAVTCWYKAKSNQGWHTLISMDVPLAAHSFFHVSIGPEGDFRFEVGIRTSTPQRCGSGKSSCQVNLNIWSHLAFSQRVERNGSVGRRVLYLDGKEVVSKQAPAPIYNPAPSMTRMAIMRGVWAYKRNAPFIGQVENIAVYQRRMSEEEIVARASRVNAPADHGWQTNDEIADVY